MPFVSHLLVPNGIIVSEHQDAGIIFASFCVKLKRLHWRSRLVDIPVSEWASALSSLSFLEALEINSKTEETDATSGEDYDPFCLPSLEHFQVSTPEEATDFLRVSKWELPPLTNLYRGSRPSMLRVTRPLLCIRRVARIPFIGCKHVVDVSYGPPRPDLVYDVVGFRNRPSYPLPCISTVAPRLFDNRYDRTVKGVCKAMRTVAWISKTRFARLETVVVIGHPIEGLDEPYQVSKLGESKDVGLACERWDQPGVRVVNRRGIRVLRLTTDEITHTEA